jgi:hypothetical protein
MSKILAPFGRFGRLFRAPAVVRDRVRIRGTVCLVLKGPDGDIKDLRSGPNVIMDPQGDRYYAQVAIAAVTTPTNDFGGANGRMVMLDATGTAPAESQNFSNIGSPVGTGNPKAFDGTYPQDNDSDPDNTGAGTEVLTYRTSYTTAEANGTITRVAIHLNGATGTDPILMYAAITGGAFTKTSSDTLKAYVNHDFTGT